ncbi:Origin of replication complex subunit 6 [Homalodisca vitripennis]|nr:Origin of replication complex subunit 6 [Homalodisca vitripennis]
MKGYEYVRLLKLKRGAGLVNMSDTCAMVICLNLAADKLNHTFDKTQAVKLAAVTKKNYASLYHTVEKVLGLDKPVTVSELCVRLACTEVSELAQRLIDRSGTSLTANVKILRYKGNSIGRLVWEMTVGFPFPRDKCPKFFLMDLNKR